ncbi:hypothetical protein HK101_005154 [Irineochytrium annulatum]|nr:hypothetical protein HK101_005154 [Irineochytrium annulatum]
MMASPTPTPSPTSAPAMPFPRYQLPLPQPYHQPPPLLHQAQPPPQQPQSHSQSHPLRCSHCPKQFKTTAALKSHQAVHDPSQPFRCDICDRPFKRNTDMRRHRSSHPVVTTQGPHGVVHTTEGVKRHACGRCGRAFGRRDGLLAHWRSNACLKGARRGSGSDGMQMPPQGMMGGSQMRDPAMGTGVYTMITPPVEVPVVGMRGAPPAVVTTAGPAHFSVEALSGKVERPTGGFSIDEAQANLDEKPAAPGKEGGEAALRTLTFKTGNFRMSVWKVNLVAKVVRGMMIPEAQDQLDFLKKRAATHIGRLVTRVSSHLEHNYSSDRRRWRITHCFVGKGQNLKRLHIMGRGKHGLRTIPYCHVKLTIKEVPESILTETWLEKRQRVEFEKLLKIFRKHKLHFPMKYRSVRHHHPVWSKTPWKYITRQNWMEPSWEKTVKSKR